MGTKSVKNGIPTGTKNPNFDRDEKMKEVIGEQKPTYNDIKKSLLSTYTHKS